MESETAVKDPGITSYNPSSELAGVSPAQKPTRSRIDSVDLLRGLVMVIMLLDHTRDFVHGDALRFEPTDMSRTYPILFFTRWITHFCAPVFVFLAGTGSYFQVVRGKSKSELSRFLVTRGFWLIFLELTAVRIGAYWAFSIELVGVMQVIWALGWCMIALAALIHLRMRFITAFGVAMIALHNLTDGIRVASWQAPGDPVPSVLAKLWMTLHQGGTFPIAGWPSPVIVMFYPLIPWIGVIALGYAFGQVYDHPSAERRRMLLRWGIAITAGFVILRLTNFYGDPDQWSTQKTVAMTVVSFLNLQKYPPSLLYLMMTLGPAMIALSFWEGYNAPDAPRPTGVSRALITFGRVPLFFYLLQWPVAHGFGYFLSVFVHKPTDFFFTDIPPSTVPPAQGFDLWVVYVCWIAGVLLLYPVCRWYAAVKSRRRDWWLSYL